MEYLGTQRDRIAATRKARLQRIESASRIEEKVADTSMKAHSKRGYSVYQRLRQKRAQERLEISSKLTVQQKLEKAHQKEQNGISCSKEIAKYERMIEVQQSQNKRVPKQEQSEEQKHLNDQRQKKKVAHDQEHAKKIGN